MAFDASALGVRPRRTLSNDVTSSMYCTTDKLQFVLPSLRTSRFFSQAQYAICNDIHIKTSIHSVQVNTTSQNIRDTVD